MKHSLTEFNNNNNNNDNDNDNDNGNGNDNDNDNNNIDSLALNTNQVTSTESNARTCMEIDLMFVSGIKRVYF